MKQIRGTFDGQIMVGEDGNSYPIPPNYASKSRLIEGDKLVLKIKDNGSFIFKQVCPADRMRLIAEMIEDEDGKLHASHNGKMYRIIDASISFYKLKEGDKVTIIIPNNEYAHWAAIDNVIC